MRATPDPERKATEAKYARDLVGAFVDQVIAQKGKLVQRSQDSVKAIQRMIEQIDRSIGEQLDTILHNEDSRAWSRGGAACTTS